MHFKNAVVTIHFWEKMMFTDHECISLSSWCMYTTVLHTHLSLCSLMSPPQTQSYSEYVLWTKSVSLTSLDMGAAVVPREGTELFWYVIRGSELWWFREDRPYMDEGAGGCMTPPREAAAVLEWLTPPRAPALGIHPEGTPPMLLPRILFKLGIDRPMRSENTKKHE